MYAKMIIITVLLLAAVFFYLRITIRMECTECGKVFRIRMSDMNGKTKGIIGDSVTLKQECRCPRCKKKVWAKVDAKKYWEYRRRIPEK